MLSLLGAGALAWRLEREEVCLGLGALAISALLLEVMYSRSGGSSMLDGVVTSAGGGGDGGGGRERDRRTPAEQVAVGRSGDTILSLWSALRRLEPSLFKSRILTRLLGLASLP